MDVIISLCDMSPQNVGQNRSFKLSTQSEKVKVGNKSLSGKEAQCLF